MKRDPQEVTGNRHFDIHKKIKESRSHWVYLKTAQPYQGDANYEFITNLIDGIEFAIYQRYENIFVLVDFFKSYDDACDDAKKIIDEHPDIKNMFSARSLIK
ncbi:hypothetical protein ABKT77_16535 [Enterobacter cloacae]|uniref:hypothetical protein n=1 Tax=Enterobacter cloacae TaxID=550 RepID=UPI0032AFFF40